MKNIYSILINAAFLTYLPLCQDGKRLAAAGLLMMLLPVAERQPDEQATKMGLLVGILLNCFSTRIKFYN